MRVMGQSKIITQIMEVDAVFFEGFIIIFGFL